jgi:hypothetical protein
MLNRRALLLVALFTLLAAFAAGLVHLFNLRFASGDVYPHYSSFRADPLGCRAYFESLSGLAGTPARRFTQSIEKIPPGARSTVFIFGLAWDELSATPNEFKALENFVRDGGRLVITLYPELARPRFFASGYGTNRPAFKRATSDDEPESQISLRAKWGFGCEHIPTPREGSFFAPVTARRIQPGPYPTNLTWHSALVFTNLDFPWRVLYARGTDPVMIERQIDRGSVILSTDSYFVSNEALRKERAADLLAWLPGTAREVWFDETHLGVQENPCLAALARRYGLQGGALALLTLAVLFIWKNSASFTPRGQTSEAAETVRGRDSAAGFENLLRRSIAPKNLLQAALDEWHKSASLDPRVTPARREKIRAVVEAFNASDKPNAVDTWREITRILNHRGK